jgi:dolichol kinase
MAVWSLQGTKLFLLGGCLIYTCFETLRIQGIKIPVVSTLTRMASRPRDTSRFVMGPVTLGLGAFFALTIFPRPAATVAIHALAFGDGFAGLVGRTFGRLRPAFLKGKSLEGSFACFVAVFISIYIISGSVRLSVIAAATAVIVEALPLGDYDNIALPFVVGMVVQYLA